MSRPKRHHYLPESYQSFFSIKGDSTKIAFIDIKRSRKDVAPTRALAAIGNLYTQEKPVQGESPTHIENPLLSNIDGTYPRIMRDLIPEMNKVTIEELATYIGFLRTRTPTYFNTIENICKNTVIKEEELVLELIKSGINDIKELRNFIAELFNDFKVPKDLILKLFRGQATNTRNQILSSDLNFFISPDYDFITSDNPFARESNSFINIHSGEVNTIGKFIIPLSSRICMTISQPAKEIPTIQNIKISPDIAKDINITIAYNASDWIFGSSIEILEHAYISSETEKDL